MKLERVALRGFLSHQDTDWTPNGARLVSLVGPNGAGKSTLASDALSFALFDQARGRTDDVVRLGETEASVLVEFAYGGERYRVERGRSTKAGGKSRLELAIADGEAWRPLTRETIRETQTAIAELLKLDADTFATAVLLAQGQANRFAEATAAERKRILGTVLGLDVYAAAEARARELARDVEARTAADREQYERLEHDVAGGREVLEPELADARSQLLEAEASIGWATGERAAIDERIRELEATLAAAQAVADRVASLERERAAARDTWQACRVRIEIATAEVARLEGLLADRATVETAAAAVPARRAEVDRLMATQAEDARLAREISEMDRAIRDLEIPHQQAVATWTAQHAAAAAKVAELEAHLTAGAAVCQACGQPIDQDTAVGQLNAARAAVKALGERPQEPISIARARAGRIRLQDRVGELKWDPAALVKAREELTALERVAARADSLAAARASIDRERAAIAAAEAEQATISARGRALTDEIANLAPAAGELDMVEAALASARNDRAGLSSQLEQLESGRRQLERAIAGAEARLEELAKAEAQAAELRARIAGANTEAGRLRRLVQAFGVTGIPARIIEGVLPELAGHANELLAELRPGMTLDLRAQRAKRDGKGVVEALDLVVRDAAGERPLALYSGGERMSVSLALAVGLSRLVARRAGARIATLVVDEPDGLDAEARRAFGMALRTIAHRGDLERCVLVSHHADLAEYADEVYQVSKGPNGSVVELVG